MAIELKVPSVGESITEIEIGQWLKAEGDIVNKDENVVALESEKATVELPAPASGTLSRIVKRKGDKALVGEVIAYLEPSQKSKDETRIVRKAEKAPTTSPPAAAPAPATSPAPSPALAAVAAPPSAAPPVPAAPTPAPPSAPSVPQSEPATEVAKAPAPRTPLAPGREEEVVRMTPLRRTVARRLVEAQHSMAVLTTFNEIDLSAVIALRQEHQESFTAKHGVKLGFMSFFVKASIEALKAIPQLNATVLGEDIVYHNYFDIGIAIGSGKGLAVPVLRNAEQLSFAEVEKAVADFAARAKDNKLKPDELQGGTFTITNGGVYGSLLSTPIVNPPQSGILGMHAIQQRPVALGGNVVIRPMMYTALSYDHRLVDGREAVTFLVRIKEMIEHPARILLEI
ncbi:MAG TPA: 2-oxoglutarate dehydrogenase complex dihydrolipoyllysine-residue succinyltransferase [Verrucomicrobiae bacterium]|jgi:2-oxoglutarate dehydrogenase E2 component (dihydrolipoamide succinyltransferase)|nr:2-oxoglutarate dehydrogenase complex dihydrolipoyllysine-residue succinyltransferase [Verrucomicrobiae bacterium]